MFLKVVLLLQALATIITAEESPCSVVLAENVTSFGVVRVTFNGVAYCEYLGVRYAEPPIGDRRFTNPVLRHPSEPENFTQLGSECLQNTYQNGSGELTGDEDCLFLNVFSPYRDERVPVLVFIHGGSFRVGSASSDINGVDLLIEQGVAVVTLNYRLGVLGFLRNSRLNISGNFGMKDQLVALQWVQQHIHSFGGDPARVTLMGQSAGGDAVSHALYSRRFSGLFQQAVILGGSLLAPAFFFYDGDLCSEAFLDQLNVSSIEELRSLDREEFLNELVLDKVSYIFAGMDLSCFVASLEDSEDPTAIVTQNPIDLVREVPVNVVPLLVGQTAREFELLDIADYALIVNVNFPNAGNETLLKNITSLVQNVVKDSGYRAGELANVANQYYPVKRLLREWLQTNYSEPIYYLRFEFDGRFGHGKSVILKEWISNESYGAVHGDDLGYIFTPFNVKQALQDRSLFSKEWQVHQQMVELFANFVKQGNPNGNNLVSSAVEWTTYNSGKPITEYLNVDESLELCREDDDRYDIYQLWESVYECIYSFNCSDVQDLADATP